MTLHEGFPRPRPQSPKPGVVLTFLMAVFGILFLQGCALASKAPAAKPPYIFVQQHNAKGGQFVRLGWPLQVQLPGNPNVWTYKPNQSTLVEPRGRTLIFSPGRIDLTQSIYVFDFVLSPHAKVGDQGIITLTTPTLPVSLQNVLPGGRYQIKFTVSTP